MDKYVICMDAGGNINKKYLKENSICFVPMEYSIGDKIKCCSGIEPDDDMVEFYKAQKAGLITKTSQVTPFGYENYFRGILNSGFSILYLALSSGLSNTFQSALLASQALKSEIKDHQVIPVDTLSATGGIGILIERAVNNLKKGMSIQENAANLNKAAKCINIYFMVDDLMYLRRGGRISSTTAIIGSALNIKPVMEIDVNGKLVTLAKKHGTKAALLDILNRFEERYIPNKEDVIYICGSDFHEKSDFLKEHVKEKYPNAKIYDEILCPVIGCHTGPGMVSLGCIGKEK
ncbi:MAG: DegV family protein [Bacilli bacterium]